MTKIILEQASRAKLEKLAEHAELCDESGRTLGYYTPAAVRSLYDSVEVPFTEEELRAAEAETESFTTEEVLAHLKSLEQCSPRH